MDNRTITEAVLTKRQVNSLRSLQNKVETTPHMFTRVSPAQFKAMQLAYAAVAAMGGSNPEIEAEAKKLGIIK